MIRKISFLLLMLLLLAFSCEKDPIIPSVEPEPEVADKTVLMYVMAQNSLSSFVEKDVEQMKQAVEAGALGKNNRLILYIDDYKAPRLVRLRKDAFTGKAVCDTIKLYEEHLSVDPEVMKEVFSLVFDQYPAHDYGLVLWSHGEGWLPDFTPKSRWIGVDNDQTSRDDLAPKMNIPELVRVLKQFPKFEFILFDACFMQSVEVAYELRECTRYMLGSVTETPGPGAPYQQILQSMYNAPCDINKFIEDYYVYYSTKASAAEWTYGAAISAIDCSGLDALANETAIILRNHVAYLDNPNLANIQIYDQRTPAYYYDLSSFIKSFATDGEYRVWKEILDRCVPESFRKSTPSCYAGRGILTIDLQQYSGISTYIMRPGSSYSKYNAYYKELSWYTAAGWNQTNWESY